MTKRFIPVMKSLSALLINFSAVWFAFAFITPNYTSISLLNSLLLLTKDIAFGMVYLFLSVFIERNLEYVK
jgi:hypothetical protein